MRKTIDTLYREMPWDEIDTVVFDVGNVLVTPGFKSIFQSVNFKDEDEVYTRTYKSPYWIMLDLGMIKLDEAIDAMTGWREDLRQDIDFAMRHWMECKSVKEEGANVLRLCKEHGKKLIVLSNYSENGFTYLREHFDIFNLFDDIIVSYQIGLLKPDIEIFRYVENRCRLNPSRTLLIDDNAVNCEAALRAGWHSICANATGKLRDFFKSELSQ